MTVSAAAQETKQKIAAWLDDLPPQSLTLVEQFVEFLRQKARQQQSLTVLAEPQTPYLYPTVENPASSLSEWRDLIPGGCGGDALADTEAIYDEV